LNAVFIYIYFLLILLEQINFKCGVLPLNPLKGTSVPEKTEINYGLFMPQKSPLGDLGVILKNYAVS